MDDLKLNGVAVVSSWLTQRSFRAAHCDFLLAVTAQNRDEVLAKFRSVGELGKYRGLRVVGIADLSFLAEFTNLLYLEVLDQKRVDTRPVESLANLRGLRLESPGTGLDFACFPHLEVFVGDWHPENRNLSRCGELRQLRTWQFKPKSADLSDLQGITRLERLDLTQTNVASLAGVDTLEDLRYLEVAYAPKLADLTSLAGHADLRELELDKCKSIASYAPLAQIPRLRRLKLSTCAAMPSLKWTKGMEFLDFFSFVDTTVADGDLSPLLDLPRLEYVGTLDKRHHNYKCDQLNALLAARDRHRTARI